MKHCLATACALMLAACGSGESGSPSSVTSPALPAQGVSTPLAEMTTVPRYTGQGVFAPFSPMRRWMRSSPDVALNDESSDEDLLQTVGLDAMRYVGYLKRGAQRVALLDVAGTVRAVHVGQRIGVEGASVRRIDDLAVTFYLPLSGEGARTVALPQLRLQRDDKHAKSRE